MITRRQFNRGLGASASALALSSIGAPAIAQRRGGDVIVAAQAAPPTLDAVTSSAEASRNITLHIFETLLARDEAANVKPDLAESVDVSTDGLEYKFKLRSGVKFHNGKVMTSADVKGSLERFARVGNSKQVMDPVAAIETPDSSTVVCKLRSPSPGFLEGMSSPRAPAAIVPAEEAGKAPNQMELIGTGPFRFVEFRPDSHALLRRFDDYVPNTNYRERDGFAGKKTAHFDTVRFRFMPEAGARSAGLQTGELHVLDSLDAQSAERLRSNNALKMHPMLPWAYQTLILNHSQAPMNNLKLRQAIQAVLNMEEIMAISTNGQFRLEHGWQHPGTQYFAGDVGKPLYNMKNADLARRLLQESGYRNEQLVILTDSNIGGHKESGEVAQEQLRAVGINARLNVVDWPTAFQMRTRPEGWHIWTLQMGIEPYEGPYNVVSFFTGTQPAQHVQDEGINAANRKLTTSLQLADRQAAVREFQQRMYENVVAIKCGDTGRIQATRANVENYKPYRIPRMWDCWFS
jgi:peptide/nickel transport system substrate-binding protein